MEKKQKKRYLIAAAACLLIVFGIAYYYSFTSFSTKDDTYYLYIDNNDNVDSVIEKLEKISSKHSMSAFKTMLRHSEYADNIRTGCYAITPNESTFKEIGRAHV